jgi:hypothetical protein
VVDVPIGTTAGSAGLGDSSPTMTLGHGTRAIGDAHKMGVRSDTGVKDVSVLDSSELVAQQRRPRVADAVHVTAGPPVMPTLS